MQTISNGKTLKLIFPVIKTDKYAFDRSIESVQMSSTVRRIMDSAFCSCSCLKDIAFSEKLEEIRAFAFSNCSELKSIKLPDSLKKIENSVFKNCTKLETIVIPEGITELSDNLFENCTSLTKVVLPQSLEIIGAECFSGCISLKEIILPSRLKAIRKKAFKRCSGLELISFPEGVQFIGDMAFEYCNGLSTIIFEGEPAHIGASVFPESTAPTPAVSDFMFCSSFVPKSDYEMCPTIHIPKTIKKLVLGFENTLNYKRANENKTCYRHILSLEKYKAKVFIGERYYSYCDREDYLIHNGSFDFFKYDMQFDRAELQEKPIIAAFRLAYPVELREEHYLIYKTHLTETQAQAALFAVQKNEENVLKYITDNFELSSEFCSFLYETAAKNGFSNLQLVLSQKKKKTGFEEIDFLYNDLLI